MFLIDVVQVTPLPERKLRLVFEDGLTAIVDIDQVVDGYKGIFGALLDEEFFSKVRVEPGLGTIVWPNGADICPDVLYSFASGKPIIIRGERVLN